jgi:hypothetical protein
MRILLRVLVFYAAFAATTAFAQPEMPSVPISPAPVLGIGKDAFGRAIPFGVPPYFTPDTPLGSGSYKAVMATDLSLPEHVLYYPANLEAAGKLPIISWGNGACMHAGNRFRSFLTDIASHGFLVISAGRMGHVSLEVGPQEYTVQRPGDPPPPPAAPLAPDDPSAPWRLLKSDAGHLKQAIDWAIAENGRRGSKFYGRIDTVKIAVAGQSCGGALAAEAAADSRVTTLAIFNSASTSLTPLPGSNVANAADFTAKARARMDGVHSPVMYLTGDEAHDGGYPVAHEIFKYLTKVPVFHAWEEGLSHIASYGASNGGALARIASDWFAWQLKGDQQAGRMFQGPDCTLCREPTWHVQKKNMK